MIAVYKAVSQIMNDLGLNYAPHQWAGELTYPYFVGRFNATDASMEAGRITGFFYIDGWTRTSITELMTATERIEKAFWSRTEMVDGHLLNFALGSCETIPSGESGLHRATIQIEILEFMED